MVCLPGRTVTRQQAEEIRTRYKIIGVSQQSLANEYHVSQSLIAQITSGKWRLKTFPDRKLRATPYWPENIEASEIAQGPQT